jgi:hypothetical protein
LRLDKRGGYTKGRNKVPREQRLMHRMKSERIQTYLRDMLANPRSIKSASYLYQCMADDYIYMERQTCVCPTCWKCWNLFGELKKDPYKIEATDLERMASGFSGMAVTRPELHPAAGTFSAQVWGRARSLPMGQIISPGLVFSWRRCVIRGPEPPTA